ncbi:MAG: hypothetical protein LIP05_11190 [Tannerellaceae bacterium]|nr:hypothetical protein [Tannerellaceae bacterium]
MPERVLTDKAFKGYSDKEFRQATQTLPDNYKELEILLTDTNKCTAFINREIKNTHSDHARLIYASVLCMLGEKEYNQMVSSHIEEQRTWDQGWHYTGMHQFGMCLSHLDAMVTALGKAKDLSTLPVILQKADLLEPEDYFSHFRAICMATESIHSKESVETLFRLLMTPGVQSYAITSYEDARNQILPNPEDVFIRNKALKELHLARALYVCGDKEKAGETILRKYAGGLQGHYARYASEILNL